MYADRSLTVAALSVDTNMATVLSKQNRITRPRRFRIDSADKTKTSRCCLSAFDVLHAPAVASWITSDRELTWLAPATPPPLTAAKVAAWGRGQSHRLLLWIEASADPVGYAELNKMPRRPDRMWIGHCVLDPNYRGRGLGKRFVQALCCRAFRELAAIDVSLVVIPENRSAIACYQKCGMIIDGRERKHFETTRRSCDFLRMSIDLRQFNQRYTAERLSRIAFPFVPNSAPLRMGPASRRRIITQS